MALKPKLTVDQDDFQSGWAETRSLFPLDIVLRNNGFRIHARPVGREAMWSKDGKVFTFTAALRLCPRDDVRKAADQGGSKLLKGGLEK